MRFAEEYKSYIIEEVRNITKLSKDIYKKLIQNLLAILKREFEHNEAEYYLVHITGTWGKVLLEWMVCSENVLSSKLNVESF